MQLCRKRSSTRAVDERTRVSGFDARAGKDERCNLQREARQGAEHQARRRGRDGRTRRQTKPAPQATSANTARNRRTSRTWWGTTPARARSRSTRPCSSGRSEERRVGKEGRRRREERGERKKRPET